MKLQRGCAFCFKGLLQRSLSTYRNICAQIMSYIRYHMPTYFFNTLNRLRYFMYTKKTRTVSSLTDEKIVIMEIYRFAGLVAKVLALEKAGQKGRSKVRIQL